MWKLPLLTYITIHPQCNNNELMELPVLPPDLHILVFDDNNIKYLSAHNIGIIKKNITLKDDRDDYGDDYEYDYNDFYEFFQD